MKNLVLEGVVKTQLAVGRGVDWTVNRYNKVKNESGSVVETVILIGLFVVICLVVGALIFSATQEQGEKLSSCISGINNFAGESQCGG